MRIIIEIQDHTDAKAEIVGAGKGTTTDIVREKRLAPDPAQDTNVGGPPNWLIQAIAGGQKTPSAENSNQARKGQDGKALDGGPSPSTEEL
ncbi:MAG TPA: hypothetical protein VKB46_11205 [Pyrinomonadaceae bacterium]|nr:hypothetical protein [Pyrinomonadaceae bacterium]